MSSPTPPEARVSRSTHVLLSSIMLLFFTGAVTFTLQARWYYWLIPAAFALVVAVILVQRRRAWNLRKAMPGR